jgi:hypothetical protein
LLDASAADAQVPANRWRDEARVAALAAIEVAKAERRVAGWWLGLALACLAVAAGILEWWRRRTAAARAIIHPPG